MEMNESLQGRVILVETAENKWRCEDNPEIKKNIGSVVVYTYDEVKANEAQFIGGISANKPEVIGRTYIYNAAIDKFILNDGDVDINFYKEQLICFADFVRLLGAVKFTGKVKISDEDKLELENKTKVKAKAIKANIDVCIKSESELEQSIMIQDTLKRKNGKYTEEDYNKAVDIFNDTHLLKNNLDCWGLLRGRNPKEHMIKSRKVCLLLSKNLQSSIDIATKLSAVKLFSVKNDFTRKRIVNKKVEVEFEVEF